MSLSPLIVAVVLNASGAGAPTRHMFKLGVLAGIIYFIGTLYWVQQVMATYGGVPAPAALLIALLLAGYLALFPGLFAILLGTAVRGFGMAGIWFTPALWVATEWLRASLGSGFPWALLGSSQAPVLPVVQLASVTGVYGLSALVALVSTAAAAVALSQRRAHRIAALGVAALLVTVVVFGAWRAERGALLAAGTPLRVGLLQGNVPQDVKWDPAYREAILQRYVDLSRQVIGAGAQIVVWPEASTPFYFDLDAAMAAPVRRLAAESRTPFLVGTDEAGQGPDGRDAYYNAAVLVDRSGRSVRSYRKIRLVPFGEYVPLKQLLFFVGPLVQAVSDFTPGTEPVVFDAGGIRLSVAICYESVYPDLARQFVRGGSELLTTITNDAWFGRSSAAYQHFEQGAIRAVEEGRYLVRAANTGISGAVDPYGRTLTATNLFEPAAVTVDVRLLTDRTIYNVLGDVVVWISLAAAVTVFVAGRRRRR